MCVPQNGMSRMKKVSYTRWTTESDQSHCHVPSKIRIIWYQLQWNEQIPGRSPAHQLNKKIVCGRRMVKAIKTMLTNGAHFLLSMVFYCENDRERRWINNLKVTRGVEEEAEGQSPIKNKSMIHLIPVKFLSGVSISLCLHILSGWLQNALAGDRHF